MEKNQATNHEREALNLIASYATIGRETRFGMKMWIELNDEKARISWGRVKCVTRVWDVAQDRWLVSFDCIDDDGFLVMDNYMYEESDEDQQAIVNILCDYSADFDVHSHSKLKELLIAMADYASEQSDEDLQNYFEEIVSTGLFHDAMGKVVGKNADGEVVTTRTY